jgi:hypothetical protein
MRFLFVSTIRLNTQFLESPIVTAICTFTDMTEHNESSFNKYFAQEDLENWLKRT